VSLITQTGKKKKEEEEEEEERFMPTLKHKIMVLITQISGIKQLAMQLFTI
jgi:hypothetical protein